MVKCSTVNEKMKAYLDYSGADLPQKRAAAADSLMKLLASFEPKRLLFSKPLAARIEAFTKEYISLLVDFTRSLDNRPNTEDPHFWTNAKQRFDRQVEPLLEEVADEFRSILGVRGSTLSDRKT